MRQKNDLLKWLLIFIISVISFSLMALFIRPSGIVLGTTISPHYAEELGLNARDILIDAHRQLGMRHFRIPVHWWRYEHYEGEFNFSELDELLDYADNNNLHITLAVGQKVPRWPECFDPFWVEDYSQADYEVALMNFLQQVLARYADRPSIRRWQVENEAYFPFGECRKLRPEFVQLEKNVVRSVVPNRMIQTTVSGEQSFWAMSALRADIVGASLYRTVASPGIGHLTFPHIPFWYRAQATLTRLIGSRVIISELQAEPWGVHSIDRDQDNFTQVALEAFPASRLREQVYFAKATGIREIYLWGIEWWYLLKVKGESALWNEVGDLIDDYVD